MLNPESATPSSVEQQYFYMKPKMIKNYIKESRMIGQVISKVGGHSIKQSLIEIDSVGVACNQDLTLTRAIKHIIADPPISIEMLREISVFKESLGLIDSQILSQFLEDMKDQQHQMHYPRAIFKFENEEMIDSCAGDIHYIVRVWFDTDHYRIKYIYERVGWSEPNGKFTLKKVEKIQ